MDSDNEMRVLAFKKADEIVLAIVEAAKNPTKQISGEALKVYNELQEWNWFDDMPIEKSGNLNIYRKMIAMTQYRHMKWVKSHPTKEKPRSKWEYVMGRMGSH